MTPDELRRILHRGFVLCTKCIVHNMQYYYCDECQEVLDYIQEESFYYELAEDEY